MYLAVKLGTLINFASVCQRVKNTVKLGISVKMEESIFYYRNVFISSLLFLLYLTVLLRLIHVVSARNVRQLLFLICLILIDWLLIALSFVHYCCDVLPTPAFDIDLARPYINGRFRQSARSFGLGNLYCSRTAWASGRYRQNWLRSLKLAPKLESGRGTWN